MYNNEVINEIMYDYGRIIVLVAIIIILTIAYCIFKNNKIGFLTACFALSVHFADLVIRFCVAVKPGMVGITGIPAVRFLILHDDIHPEQYFWALFWGIGICAIIMFIGIITLLKVDVLSIKLDTTLYRITVPAMLGGPYLLYSYINTIHPDYAFTHPPLSTPLIILRVACYFGFMLFIGYIVTVILVNTKKRLSLKKKSKGSSVS